MSLSKVRLGYKNQGWFDANPGFILGEGQHVYLEQTGTYKVGDGVTTLINLNFLGASGSSAWVDLTGLPTDNSDLVNYVESVANQGYAGTYNQIATSSTPQPIVGGYGNTFRITALATSAVIQGPTGAWAIGGELVIEIVDNGTRRTISFDPAYYLFNSGITAPTQTTSGVLILKFVLGPLGLDCILCTSSSGALPTLTSTYVGVGNGSNLLSGSTALTYASNKLYSLRSNIGAAFLGENNSFNLGGDSPIIAQDGSGRTVGIGYSGTATDFIWSAAQGMYLQGHGNYGVLVPGTMTVQSGLRLGDSGFSTGAPLAVTGNSYFGNAATTPSARIHILAGSATASTAPIKLTTGIALTTPEDGAIEYHASHLYFTIGSTRYQLDQQIPSFTNGSVIFSNGTSLVQDNTNFFFDDTNNLLYIGGNTGAFANTKIQAYDNVNSFSQVNYQNKSNGTTASADYVATADTGTNTTNYVDFGINSSTFNDAAFTIGGALAGYAYSNGGNMLLGSQTNDVIIFAGGTLAANERMRITASNSIVTSATTALGFYGVTAISQPANSTDLGTVLSSLGLRTAGTAYPITTSGAVILTGTFTTSNINKVTITAPTTSATLTLVNGSSLITAGAFALTLTTTATTNATLPTGSGTLAYLAGANTWSGTTTFSNTVVVSGASLTTKHLIGNSTAPAIAAGAGAGTTPTVSLSGTDLSGFVSVTTGTVPTASAVVVTITFNVAYSAAPKCVLLTPANAVTAAISGTGMVFVDQAGISTTIFAITAGTVGLVAATAYKWYYTVIQ